MKLLSVRVLLGLSGFHEADNTAFIYCKDRKDSPRGRRGFEEEESVLFGL